MTPAARSIEVDSVYMRRALALALEGWGHTAPNPMVGAVVVAGNHVVGEGYHARYGEAHAETVALQAAGDRTRGATLYVSLEPCAHFGKTPPCVDAVIAAGIARVVVAVRDPTTVARGGVERLRAAGIQVDVGIERSAACELNAPFMNAYMGKPPWVILKLAVSADGGIADPTGRQRWITGAESRREVHRLRAGVDAIAVGIGTVLADDPSLTVRDAPAPRVSPRRIVFDSSLRIPIDSVLVRTAREIDTSVIASMSAAIPDKIDSLMRAGVDVVLQPSIRATLDALPTRGIHSLLVEGGARLAGSLIAESLVHRLVIFRSPLTLGERALKAFAYAPDDFEASLEHQPVVERRQLGPDVMTTYALQNVPCSPD